MNRYFKLVANLMIAVTCGNDNSNAKKAKAKEAPIPFEDQLL